MQNITRMRFLHRCVIDFATPTTGIALEIGVYKAASMIFLAKACLKKGITRVYGVDLFGGPGSWQKAYDTFEAASQRLRKYDLDRNVVLLRSHSQEYPWDKTIDVFHLDADHEYGAVTADIRKYVPFLAERGIAIFDDYDAAHPGVQKAVHELLIEREDFEIIGINYQGGAYGSLCLRKRHKHDPEATKTRVNLFDRLLNRCEYSAE